MIDIPTRNSAEPVIQQAGTDGSESPEVTAPFLERPMVDAAPLHAGAERPEAFDRTELPPESPAETPGIYTEPGQAEVP